MAYKLGKKQFRTQPLYRIAAVLVISLIILVAAIIGHRPSLIPLAIGKQLTFVVFYPDKSWQVAPTDISYDAQSKVLTIKAKKNGQSLVMKQQAAPSQFNDIPQYYPALLNKLNQYDSFGTANGTVNLVKPTELQTAPQAVLYSDGTLLFVAPAKTFSTAVWRHFFTNIRVVK